MEYPLKSFLIGSCEASIKYSNRKDIGIIVSPSPASCAAVFTRNRFAAAPVLYSREILSQNAGFVSGVVVNSGCANAATGQEGYINAAKMADLAQSASNSNGPFLVCSTGTIGVQLPMDKLESGIPSAAANLQSGNDAFIDFAKSIMTTDTVHKVAYASYEHDGKTVSIAGCAKGSGMIHPNMATMLSFIITDANVAPPLLQEMFSRIVDRTLNCVTVDGDTSTNDTAIVLANGASGSNVVAEDGTGYNAFETALTKVLTDLARQLARDGEGATHLIQVQVTGAPTFIQARTAALAVANSPLVKTAIYGRDANWGRIACALGNSGVEFNPNVTDIRIGDLELMVDGVPLNFSEDRALEILAQEEIHIYADLKNGVESATAWTCDLTEQYIEINGSYRT